MIQAKVLLKIGFWGQGFTEASESALSLLCNLLLFFSSRERLGGSKVCKESYLRGCSVKFITDDTEPVKVIGFG